MRGIIAYILTIAPLLLRARVNAQAINPDAIDLTTEAVWPDLRDCLHGVLDTSAYYDVFGEVGCETNACVCRGSTLGDAVGIASSLAVDACSNLDDASTAMSLLTSYCSAKGYTAIVSPTILNSGASATVTVVNTDSPAVTVTVAVKTIRVVHTVTASAAVRTRSAPDHLMGQCVLASASVLLGTQLWLGRALMGILARKLGLHNPSAQ